MPRIVIIALMLIFLLCQSTYALDTKLFDMRNKIFSEADKIKPLIADSTDSVLLSSLLDTCIVMVTRLDAYLNILGVFNTIDEFNINNEAVDYVIGWLNSTKTANNISIRGLYNISKITDERIKPHIETLKIYLKELNGILEAEIDKSSTIKKSLKIKSRRR